MRRSKACIRASLLLAPVRAARAGQLLEWASISFGVLLPQSCNLGQSGRSIGRVYITSSALYG